MGYCFSSSKVNAVTPLSTSKHQKKKAKTADDLDIACEDLKHIDDQSQETPSEAKKTEKTAGDLDIVCEELKHINDHTLKTPSEAIKNEKTADDLDIACEELKQIDDHTLKTPSEAKKEEKTADDLDIAFEDLKHIDYHSQETPSKAKKTEKTAGDLDIACEELKHIDDHTLKTPSEAIKNDKTADDLDIACEELKQIDDHTLKTPSEAKKREKTADDLDIAIEDLKPIDDHALKTPSEPKKKVNTDDDADIAFENLKPIDDNALKTPREAKKKEKTADDLDISFEDIKPIDDHALKTPSEAKKKEETDDDLDIACEELKHIDDHTLKTHREAKKKAKIADDLDIAFEDLKFIDDHALKTPTEAEESIDTLAAYLAKPAKNNVEIVRAIYVWITDNISYNTDVRVGGGKAQTKVDDVLKCKTTICGGYASLFLDLCTRNNIECKKIDGFCKGYSHVIGKTMSYNKDPNHAWNIVFIEGKWRFIETTWGSGQVDKNQKFVKEFSNFYFFTNPKHFIADHFPFLDNDIEGSLQWQLLATPVSLEVFSKAFNPSAYAIEWGIEFPSSRYEVITINKSYRIVIDSKQKPLQNACYNLWDSNGSPCQHSAVIVKEDSSRYTITIKPSLTGTYSLKIYGKVHGANKNMPMLVEYMIECTATEDCQHPYPKNPGFYGPKTDFKERGFDISHTPAAYQTCKNGNLQVFIQTTKNLKALASLYGDDGNEIQEFLLLEQTDKGVSIRARLTRTGYYIITLFSEFETSSSYSEAFNMLVLNTEPSTIQLPFPKSFSTTTKLRCNLTKPLVKYVPANSSFIFKMSSTVVHELLINGHLLNRLNDSWSTEIRTAADGIVSVSANSKNDSKYFRVYEFEVKE